MVTFSEEPYSRALEVGDEQAGIMDKIMKIPGIAEKWDSEEVEEKILSMIKQPGLKT